MFTYPYSETTLQPKFSWLIIKCLFMSWKAYIAPKWTTKHEYQKAEKQLLKGMNGNVM